MNYPIKIVQAYNRYFGLIKNGFTQKELSKLDVDEIIQPASMGLVGGKKEFYQLLNN